MFSRSKMVIFSRLLEKPRPTPSTLTAYTRCVLHDSLSARSSLPSAGLFLPFSGSPSDREVLSLGHLGRCLTHPLKAPQVYAGRAPGLTQQITTEIKKKVSGAGTFQLHDHISV